jgi:hypothetical protein
MVIVAAVCAAVLSAQVPVPPPPPKPAASVAALGGEWTLNKDLSDAPRGSEQGGDDRSAGRRGDAGGHGGGYGGRGGGRGMGRGGGGGAMPPRNPDDVARMRDAMRNVTDPPERLTIVQTDSMILITGGDGRTTRLSPDGKKIKDENTGVERKTKWDAGRLVSEISGLESGKMTQTFSVDPESHQLRVTVQMEGGRSKETRTITHVYDKSDKS